MLITTSRKPGSRTRSFCQTLNRFFDSEYINRGKMSMRDVLLKASQLGHSHIAVVFEKHGNPSKITFYNKDGNELVYLTINVALPENRINVHKDNLTLRCEIEEFQFLGDILHMELEEQPESNYLWIKESGSDYKAIFEFFDSKGSFTGFKIFVKNIKKGEDLP